MKTETIKDVQGENSKVFSRDIVLWRKNSTSAQDDDDDDSENYGKTKPSPQLEKQKKQERNESEEEKQNLKLVDLTMKLKEKCRIFDDCLSDVISRSPMRTQECSHYRKPYYKPGHSLSRMHDGVTRVEEAESSVGSFTSDFDLELKKWEMSLKNPTFFNEFQNYIIEVCRENHYEYRSSRNECSNESSQFTTPDQSPSEQNLTSPESVTNEENSVYSKSPIIPSLDSFNIQPKDEDSQEPRTQVSYNIPECEEEGRNTPETSNIGTIMRRFIEATIDVNHIATPCEAGGEDGMEPSTVERDALNEKLDPKTKENAWTRISQIDLESLGGGDNDGDTQLMILLVSKTEKVVEYVYVLVERLLKEKPECLSFRNKANQDALCLAAFKLVREPLVASYIAEAMVRGKQDVNMKYDDGNTLLHCLAAKGDSHARVLERLVKLRNGNRTPVFNINKKNNRGFTPLHIACEVHKPETCTYQTVKVLVENGADCTAKDYKDENTPIHILINESCDVELLRILLESGYKFGIREGPPPPTVPNRQGNTALHLACGKNSLGLVHQRSIIELLLRHGAMIQLKNINGCVPSVLVDSSRKQDIKTIFNSFRQK